MFLGNTAFEYSLKGDNGNAYNANTSKPYGTRINQNDIITLVCDRVLHQLTFYVNDKSLGTAYQNLDKNVECFYFCISMYVQNQAVEII